MTDLKITSSSQTLNAMFEWAKTMALSHVQTGKPRYIPCYWCGLLDRPHFSIRDFAHQCLPAHLLGLGNENWHMLNAFARTCTEAREWYPIWILGFDGDIYHQDYHHDQDFVREIPMVFELVEAGWTLYQWTGKRDYIEEPVVWDYYTHAVEDFIPRHDLFGDGIASTAGKSSWPFNGIATYNEGDRPFAQGADAIASQYRAQRCYASMLDLKGRPESATTQRTKAETLRDYFRAEWQDGTRGYCRGRHADRSFSPGWGEMTTIYPALKGLCEPGPRSERQLALIEESAVYTIRKGVEMRTYIPETQFLHGHHDLAWERMQDVYSLQSAYPEVSFTLIMNMVTGILGVDADAPHHTVRTTPRLPSSMAWCEGNGIVVGEHVLRVRHDQTKNSIVEHISGPCDLTWIIQVGGDDVELSIAPGQMATRRCENV